MEETCLDTLLLCQRGIRKVHAGEGGDALQGLNCRRHQTMENGATRWIIPMALDFACII